MDTTNSGFAYKIGDTVVIHDLRAIQTTNPDAFLNLTNFVAGRKPKSRLGIIIGRTNEGYRRFDNVSPNQYGIEVKGEHFSISENGLKPAPNGVYHRDKYPTKPAMVTNATLEIIREAVREELQAFFIAKRSEATHALSDEDLERLRVMDGAISGE